MSCSGRGGGGYSGFQVTGVMVGFLGGCDIFDFRIFLGRKILASIFWVFKTNFSIFLVISLSALWNFLWLGIWHGIFWGLILVKGFFLGFVWSPRDFFGVLIFAPIWSSLSLEFGVPTWSALLHKFKCSVLWAKQNRIPLYLMPLLRWRT